MKINRWAAGFVTAVLAGVLALAGASTASAAYPVQDAQEHVAGSVEFYDAAGNRVYSGDGTVAEDPKYFLSTGTITATSSNKKALMAGYVPQPGQAAGLWPGMALGTNKDYPLVGAPASVSGTPANSPATFRNAADRAFKDLVLSYTAPGKPGDPDYTNLYEIRVRDFESVEYSSTYITIDPVTYAWAQVSPAPQTDTRAATTTTLTVTPPAPSTAPADLTLTANVTPTTVPGTVEFFNGATSLGAPVAVSGGSASKTLTAVPAGSFSYTAKFTPTDVAAFQASTSSAFSYAVNGAPDTSKVTTTTLVVTPPPPGKAPANVTLTATVSPNAPGKVEFFNGPNSLGDPVAVATHGADATTAAATLPVNGLSAGEHSFTAVFTPTDPTAFKTSTSSAVPYTVNAATPTTTKLTAAPASPGIAPANVALTATVTPAAAGTVEFFRGTTSLGAPTAVASGTAIQALTALTAGSYSYTAKFTPANPADYSASSSIPLAYTVNSPSTTTPTTTTTTTPTTPATTTTTTTTSATTTPAITSTAAATSTASGTRVAAPTATATGTGVPTTIPTVLGTATTAVPTTGSLEIVVATKDGKTLGANPILAPGDTITLSAQGFAAGEEVAVSVDGKKIGMVKADPDGTISYVFVVPVDQPDGAVEIGFDAASGSRTFGFTVAASAATSSTDDPSVAGVRLENPEDVAAAESGSGDSLPATGSEVGSMLSAAALLLLLGAAGLLWARRLKIAEGRHF